MPLPDNLSKECKLGKLEAEWIGLILNEGNLLAGLANSDVIFWLYKPNGQFISVEHIRPQGVFTLFHRDFVGKTCPETWAGALNKAYSSCKMIDLVESTDYGPVKIVVTPVKMNYLGREKKIVPFVVTSHGVISDFNQSIQYVYTECAQELFGMLTRGDFPRSDFPIGSHFGLPRPNDGLIRLNQDGDVIHASPKAVSVFKTLGILNEIEGENLSKLVLSLVEDNFKTDEALPLVVSGRADWISEIQVSGANVVFRSVPIRDGNRRNGAIVLCRDVTAQRFQHTQLMTRDATIREIHHRIKNSLQTVASILRLQSRRSDSEIVRAEFADAVRRILGVSEVHDALSRDLSENLNFDDFFPKLVKLIISLAELDKNGIDLRIKGRFGFLDSKYAVPLMLVLTELVANAVEHGFSGTHDQLVIYGQRTDDAMHVLVSDNGVGIDLSRLGKGLGTRIVNSIVDAEFSGRISWHRNPYTSDIPEVSDLLPARGTTVTLSIPFGQLTRSTI
ncbi:histidine kinase N-terminal domain-containing protein [Tropheryma whipplei]|uniref:histidine kinase N-terminal domain-containing protein n=1 Tax=Tropheryma whipplei TaxID=2039 RepID=UPI000000C8EC|nr:histidine kinase N-terminal domain-containing protein [Tropheryma whipplei]CAD67313.1 putative histidine kinase [Tropheryma whipplei TW08/27]